MSYLEIVKMIVNILFTVIGLLTAHFFLFGLLGLFIKRKYPKTEEKLRYALIIPARNEESVVTGLIESIQKNNYPQDKLTVFVISHNSTDRTAEVARAAGAEVYEYNNPAENTMGYAFKYLFGCIRRDYGKDAFDGYFLFNADNILDKNYISYMNDAFVACGRECVITSFRNSKNFGSNLISGLYGIYFAIGCRFESRARTALGCSTRVQGTGYVVPPHVVENGWEYVTLAEDWEFTADRVLRENRIFYCDDAVFYDEQPTSPRIMWRQRVRWSRGHLIVFFTRIKDLIHALFSPKTKHRVSIYDITVNTLPVPLIFLFIYALQLILLLIAPLIDKGLSFGDLFLGNPVSSILSVGAFSRWLNHPMLTESVIMDGIQRTINSADLSFIDNLPAWIKYPLFSDGVLFGWLRSLIGYNATLFANAILMFFVERKRIKNVKFINKVLVVLFWPLFLMIQVPIDIQAICSKNLAWKPIPHSDKTSFEHVNV